MVVDPDNVGVMEPEEGKSLVSLQTCTLPDYEQRLIVQGERTHSWMNRSRRLLVRWEKKVHRG